MNPQILLIHGFNVWDGGKATVGELRGYFAARDMPYHILKYGHFGLWDARTKNDNVARQVADFVTRAKEPVVCIGHSNGCAIIYLAITKYNAHPAHCVFINPALEADALEQPLPISFDIWHSPSDKPVKWARFLPKTQFRPWGDMGAVGATNGKPDSRIVNYNKETDYPVSSNEHSDVFRTEKLSFFGPLIVNTTLQRIESCMPTFVRSFFP